ncbi:hypothetical protein AN456_11650 [Pseudomonas aeruginosa]|nr:hypothetical protein AN455_10820 [Pseudomonas aeruginosa]KRV09010.1 hypothetical protein AN456_11650 [Pseudomonas aeruginosa]WPB09239.1 hypothetical protein [Cloning vector pMA11O14]
MLLDDTFDRKITLCQCPPSSPHLLPQLRRFDKTLNGVSQRHCVTNWHQQAGSIRFDSVPATRHICRHDYATAGSSLNQDLGKSFAIRRQDNYMRMSEDGRNILTITKTLDRTFAPPPLQVELFDTAGIPRIQIPDQLEMR